MANFVSPHVFPVKHKLLLGAIMVLLLLHGSALAALADGMIIPFPADELGYVDVEYHRVTVEISDGYARTRVEQRFYNPYPVEVSGRYVFPIPEAAAISDFRVKLDGRPQAVTTMSQGETNLYLQQAIRDHQDPTLLAYIDGETYALEVTLPPHSAKEMVLEYEEVLTFRSDLYRYLYVLSTERYSASNLQEVSVTVDLRSSKGVASVYSPSHAVTVERVSPNRVRATYTDWDVTPTEDFELYYATPGQEFGAGLLNYEKDGQDYFLFLFSPSSTAAVADSIPKDIVFVIDRSGSMSGEKMEQAKEALQFILRQLGEKDRFSIVDFDDVVGVLAFDLLSVNDRSIRDASSYVDWLHARNNTDIEGALTTGLDILAESEEREAAKVVVFLTDGLPTAGVTDERLIAQSVRRANDGVGASIHVFGVGYDVNTHLLDRLAADNHGAVVYVEPGQSLERALTEFYSQIAHPLLTEVEIAFEGIKVSEVYPQQVPDLFVGSSLVLSGKYRPSSRPVTVRITGQTAGGQREYTSSFVLETHSDRAFIPRLWATRKVGQLLDQVRVEGESEALVAEIEALGLEYGIVTPYTTLLIQGQESGAASAANMSLYRQDLDGDGQWDYNSVSGGATVKTRLQNQAYQSAQQANLARGANVANYGAKNLLQVGQYAVDLELLDDQEMIDLADQSADEWVAANLKADRVVEFGSTEYFALAKDKELQQVLQGGPNMVFHYQGYIIAVRNDASQPQTKAPVQQRSQSLGSQVLSGIWRVLFR
jgi:Ca-activated chloride channel family protein